VELSFDNITWDVYDAQRIVVVKQTLLTNIRPQYSYVNRVNNEVFLTAGQLLLSDDTFNDVYNQFNKSVVNVPSQGHTWPTELFQHLKC
jgi:hypothetical protein